MSCFQRETSNMRTLDLENFIPDPFGPQIFCVPTDSCWEMFQVSKQQQMLNFSTDICAFSSALASHSSLQTKLFLISSSLSSLPDPIHRQLFLKSLQAIIKHRCSTCPSLCFKKICHGLCWALSAVWTWVLSTTLCEWIWNITYVAAY